MHQAITVHRLPTKPSTYTENLFVNQTVRLTDCRRLAEVVHRSPKYEPSTRNSKTCLVHGQKNTAGVVFVPIIQ